MSEQPLRRINQKGEMGSTLPCSRVTSKQRQYNGLLVARVHDPSSTTTQYSYIILGCLMLQTLCPKVSQTPLKHAFLQSAMKRKQQNFQNFLNGLDAPQQCKLLVSVPSPCVKTHWDKRSTKHILTKLMASQIQGLQLGEALRELCQVRATPQIQGLKPAERPNALRKLCQVPAQSQIQGLKLAERPNALRKFCQVLATTQIQGLKLAERANALRKLCQVRAIPQIEWLKLGYSKSDPTYKFGANKTFGMVG